MTFNPFKVRNIAKRMEGIPWKHLGRNAEGLDCIGTVLYFFKQFEVDLYCPECESYDAEFWRTSKKDILGPIVKRYFNVYRTTVGVSPADIFLFRFKRVIAHIGIYVGNSKFVHCGDNKVETVSINCVEWGKRFVGMGKLK